MTSFEFSGFESPGSESDRTIIDLPFPEDIRDIDLDWVNWFNLIYGDDTLKTTITTDICLRERLGPRGLPAVGPISFDTIRFSIRGSSKSILIRQAITTRTYAGF